MNTAFSSALSNALIYLDGAYPFWAYLTRWARFEASNAVPFAAVQASGRVRINPEVFLGLRQEQRAFLIAHEIGHPAFDFFARSSGHDPYLANLAHDFAVNDMLTKDNDGWFIGGGCLDARYAGWSYEEIYADLCAIRPKIMEFPMCGDADRAEDDGAPANLTAWVERVAMAGEYARQRGDLPAHLARAIGAQCKPRVRWTHRLALMARDAFRTFKPDYTRPSRRHDNLEFLLPAAKSYGLDCAIAVDTSGSMSVDALAVAVAESAAILGAVGGSVRFLSCDAAVAEFRCVRHPKDFQLIGGGGTDFAPVFEALKRNPPKVLVYFTDLIGTFPDFSPRFKTIWATIGSGRDVRAPFGEVLAVC
jgi:predicted metal-dependent peptidase